MDIASSTGAVVFAYAYLTRGQSRHMAILLQDLIWRRHNGPIPDRKRVVHRNHISMDNRLDNLCLIDISNAHVWYTRTNVAKIGGGGVEVNTNSGNSVAGIGSTGGGNSNGNNSTISNDSNSNNNNNNYINIINNHNNSNDNKSSANDLHLTLYWAAIQQLPPENQSSFNNNNNSQSSSSLNEVSSSLSTQYFDYLFF